MPRHGDRRRKTTILFLAALLGLDLIPSASGPSVGFDLPLPGLPIAGETPGGPQAHGSLALLTEVYEDGPDLLARRLRAGLANGGSLHTELDPERWASAAARGIPLTYFAIPAEAAVSSCYPDSVDGEATDTLKELGATPTSRAWRIGAPEFDQSGGCWAQGRPRLTGMDNEQAFNAWARYYLDSKGLGPYLRAGPEQRGYRWMSVCVFAFCPQYAYDLGSDAVLLERNIDEVSDLTVGLAMIRGAARQHGDRDWGIEMSTYRYWTNGPTEFDPAGRLVSGWSPSTFERNMYAAYMAGADVILNEAAIYESATAADGLNPLGAAVRDFTDFSLRRHPDRGTPYVPIALLQDHESGFEPRFGEFDQAPRKWYRQIPYTPGDRMLEAILDLAYPGYRSWGTIPAGTPWKVGGSDGTVKASATVAGFRNALADGADPRRFEPMGSTRWGQSVDIITDHAGLDTLNAYRAVVLVNSGPIDQALLGSLDAYVRAGGTIVINVKQLPVGAEGLTRLQITDQARRATAVTWAADGSASTENPFGYTVARTTGGASVLATTPDGDPLITRNDVGSGAIYVTMADHMLDSAGRGVLASGRRLLDELNARFAAVTVNGPQVSYLVSTTPTATIITLINTDVGGAAWSGTLHVPGGQDGAAVRDWTRDESVDSTVQDGQVVVNATVPPYGVRVYAVETAGRHEPDLPGHR